MKTYLDKTGRLIEVGDVLITENDGQDGADVWDAQKHGQVRVVEICSHGITTEGSWQPESEPNEQGQWESVFALPYIRVVRQSFEG